MIYKINKQLLLENTTPYIAAAGLGLGILAMNAHDEEVLHQHKLNYNNVPELTPEALKSPVEYEGNRLKELYRTQGIISPITKMILKDKLNAVDAYSDADRYIRNLPEDERQSINSAIVAGNANLGQQQNIFSSISPLNYTRDHQLNIIRK